MIQRAIEDVGISTVSITLVEDIAKRVKPPRVLSVPYDFGHPLGEPNNSTLQHTIISEALELLQIDEPLPIFRKKHNTA
ncbi:hypothetical protein JT359_17830 [Candidatus Poribacteria bacterium]|nr:hypothetical protein [Candidatus Poribacteria bacterium]